MSVNLKALEKKKTLEDIARAKEMDKTSREAFLKAVAKKTQGQSSKGLVVLLD